MHATKTRNFSIIRWIVAVWLLSNYIVILRISSQAMTLDTRKETNHGLNLTLICAVTGANGSLLLLILSWNKIAQFGWGRGGGRFQEIHAVTSAKGLSCLPKDVLYMHDMLWINIFLYHMCCIYFQALGPVVIRVMHGGAVRAAEAAISKKKDWDCYTIWQLADINTMYYHLYH